MLSVKYLQYVLSFMLSMLMSFIMSGVITLINVGLPDDFFTLWMRAWASAFVIAYPTILLVFPLARKAAMMVCSKP
ncbi:MAG: hypothetical protein KU37_08525 [Sulfuricurvum sp. PC08-66]|nr:MAG: hypothetical protein KU37_08525 [Sulfuricurvum sp. PC08-66]